MIMVIPDIEMSADPFTHTAGRPCLISKAMMDSTLSQEGAQLLSLLFRKS